MQNTYLDKSVERLQHLNLDLDHSRYHQHTETLNPSNWSKLPLDILTFVFERLNFVDFHLAAKMVCSNWYYGSKETVPTDIESPWLIVFPDDDDVGCVLYNPYENKVYRRNTNFLGSRFLASCGKWFLMLDSRSILYIINVFSGKRIDLPPLESIKSDSSTLKRMEGRDKEFEWELADGTICVLYADEIRGRLWVDDKSTGELALAWFVDAPACFVCFYKKDKDYYDFVSVSFGVPKMLTGLYGLVLRGYRLYVLTTRLFVRIIDFSGHRGFEELTGTDPSPTFSHLGYTCYFSMVIKTAGEVLLVTRTTLESIERTFRVYKKDPSADPDDYMPDLLEVDSLDDEAILLDLGITVPADHTLGIYPNSIYFTRHELFRFGHNWNWDHVLPLNQVDICVFNISTKTLEPFHVPSNMSLKDARWIFSMT